MKTFFYAIVTDNVAKQSTNPVLWMRLHALGKWLFKRLIMRPPGDEIYHIKQLAGNTVQTNKG